MIHDETAAQNSGGAPGFARLARVAHPPLLVSLKSLKGWWRVERDSRASGYALRKKHSNSRGVKLKDVHSPLPPPESHPTFEYMAGPSPDDPFELIGHQLVVWIWIGAHQLAAMARDRECEDQRGNTYKQLTTMTSSPEGQRRSSKFRNTLSSIWLNFLRPENPCGWNFVDSLLHASRCGSAPLTFSMPSYMLLVMKK